MRDNKLGSGRLEVAELCLGTMTWGEQNTEVVLDAKTRAAIDEIHHRYPSAAGRQGHHKRSGC